PLSPGGGGGGGVGGARRRGDAEKEATAGSENGPYSIRSKRRPGSVRCFSRNAAISRARRTVALSRSAAFWKKSRAAKASRGTLWARKMRAISTESRWTSVETARIFRAQSVPREALAALLFFQKAAERDSATVRLAREIAAFLEKQRTDPGLRFDL